MPPREIIVDRQAVRRKNASCQRTERFCLRRIVFDQEGIKMDIECGELAKEFFDESQPFFLCEERGRRLEVYDVFFETFFVCTGEIGEICRDDEA